MLKMRWRKLSGAIFANDFSISSGINSDQLINANIFATIA